MVILVGEYTRRERRGFRLGGDVVQGGKFSRVGKGVVHHV